MAGRKLPSRVYQKHGAFYFVTPENKWVRLGKSLSDAYLRLGELEAEGRPGTMDGLIARYLREVTPGKAHATQRQERVHAASLRAVFGAERPENIRPMHVARYLRSREAKVSANRERALLSHVFTMGMEWGAVDVNPCLGVKRNPEKARERYAEHAEVEAVGKYLPTWAQRCVRLAYLVGQRPGDVLRTTKQQLSGSGVFYRQAKTGKRLMVEWSPALAEAVRDALDHAGDMLLFQHGGKPYTYWALNSAWRRAVAKALSAGDLSEPFQLRDVRAKAGTDGQDSNLLGNSEAVRRRHYLNRKAQRVKPTV